MSEKLSAPVPFVTRETLEDRMAELSGITDPDLRSYWLTHVTPLCLMVHEAYAEMVCKNPHQKPVFNVFLLDNEPGFTIIMEVDSYRLGVELPLSLAGSYTVAMRLHAFQPTRRPSVIERIPLYYWPYCAADVAAQEVGRFLNSPKAYVDEIPIRFPDFGWQSTGEAV